MSATQAVLGHWVIGIPTSVDSLLVKNRDFTYRFKIPVSIGYVEFRRCPQHRVQPVGERDAREIPPPLRSASE